MRIRQHLNTYSPGRIFILCLFILILSACGGGGGGSDVNDGADSGNDGADSGNDGADSGNDGADSGNDGNNGSITSQGFQSVSGLQWTDTSVRKVLNVFAYGGLANDEQISAWATMDPQDAIAEMLSFSNSNEKLSPAQDATSLHNQSLEELQNFWGSDDKESPILWHRRALYSTINTFGLISIENQQRTWVQAVNTRGINPFLHRIAFYLTNYQMAILTSRANAGPFRSYYDEITSNLVNGKNLAEIISAASKAAAVANRYEHRRNIYSSAIQMFFGNDDFAREYFQLFFRLQGEAEDTEYHENVTIENNALLLTGMDIDINLNAYGSIADDTWWVAPILFTDHTDETGRVINNASNHHTDCLEILHTQICGATAADKIDALSPIVASHPEVLNNLPVYIIKTLADDRLTDNKKKTIRKAWLDANNDLLSFLRAYAISTTFHNEKTVKFKTAFTRNLALTNAVVLNNEEAFIGRRNIDSPLKIMVEQGGVVFNPAHDVFGGQTGQEAAASTNLFKKAYTVASKLFGIGLSLLQSTYFPDEGLPNKSTWDKDWSAAAPKDSNGKYTAGVIAEWIWNRLVPDGGKNLDPIAQSQILAMLARGLDFGYLVTTVDSSISNDPQTLYTSSQLKNDPKLLSIINTLAEEEVELSSTAQSTRREANRRVNLAVSFISALPYTFAIEGK